MEGLTQTAEAPAPKRKPIPNLLRPSQVRDNKDELARLEATIKQPHVQDRPTMLGQIQRLKHTLETLSPKPYASHEIDLAVKQEKALREDLVAGMLTQEEMRTNPPGAVDHHRAWQDQNKDKILLWKHIRLRLNAEDTGAGDNVANLEMFRPRTRTGMLNTDVAQIERKAFVGLEAAGTGTTFSDADKDALRAMGEDGQEIAASLAALSNEERALVKEFLDKVRSGDAPRKRGRPRKTKEEAA